MMDLLVTGYLPDNISGYNFPSAVLKGSPSKLAAMGAISTISITGTIAPFLNPAP
jgi:hypothetical protein